ncbi:MAG: hypothetical protein M1375_02560 [Candidatus Thermoplasmatota archaeon]|jgi:hypothetical protein|nr:hypothetical protein [Candidatus Thermoplasmatota archaeon]MCL5790838.1 hypothetical protein [Candidatus Thermoplasmatota archaeon]
MGRKLFDEQKRSGNIGVGILATFLSLVIMGPILGVGWLVSGLFGGLIAKGKLQGFAAGLIGGLILTIALIEISYYVLPASINTITSYTGNFYIVDSMVKVYTETRNAITGGSTINKLVGLIVEGVVIPGIGGFIGGSIYKGTSEYD